MNDREIIDRMRAWLGTDDGARYLARRVRAGAFATMREQLRLEAWLEARAVFNAREELAMANGIADFWAQIAQLAAELVELCKPCEAGCRICRYYHV